MRFRFRPALKANMILTIFGALPFTILHLRFFASTNIAPLIYPMMIIIISIFLELQVMIFVTAIDGPFLVLLFALFLTFVTFLRIF